VNTTDVARAWLQARRVKHDDPNRCTRCGEPIADGVRVGDGDGVGQKFAHRACYDAGCAEEASLSSLLVTQRAEAERETSERWEKAMETADWDGGVFHYDGRIYPWPRGFVPDVPATWAERNRAVRRQIASWLRALACGTPGVSWGSSAGARPEIYNNIANDIEGGNDLMAKLDGPSKEIRRSGSLTYDECIVACSNMGIDLNCGACASNFFTGLGSTSPCEPSCKTVPRVPTIEDGIKNPLDDAQTERILRGIIERMTASAKKRGDNETIESLSDVNGLIVEAMAARKNAQIEAAGEAAATELLKGGWVPDGGNTYWLHSKLAPALAVSTRRALTLQRERGDKT